MTIKHLGGIFGRNPELNDVTVDGSLNLPDGKNINIGSSDDLQLYHDGNHSWIKENGSGNLYISSDGYAVNIVKGDNAATVAQFIPDSAVNLFHAGNLKIATTATGITVTGNIAVDSGSGIDFSATSGTGTSELFDDYEEGTFTVSLAPSTSGSITVNPSYQTLFYTKIGRVVYITGQIRVNAASSPVGVVNITSLPFVSASASQTPDTNFITTQVIGAAASPYVYSGYVFANSSTIVLYKNGNQTSAADFDGNEYVSISGFYCAAT